MKRVLDVDVLDQVSEIITSPPTCGNYPTIKAALAKAHRDSEEQKLRSLLAGIQLGDRKPSQLLKTMRELSQSIVTEDASRSCGCKDLPFLFKQS